MRRYITVFLLFVLVSIAPAPHVYARQAGASSFSPVVPIYVQRVSGDRIEYAVRGYAFQLREALLVTTYAIALGADDPVTYVALPGGQYTQTLQFAWDEASDTAILYAKGLSPRPAALTARATVIKGETVSISTESADKGLGYARTTVGEVGAREFEIAMQGAPVAPGSPVLDQAGDIVGLVRGPSPKGPGVATVVAPKTLEDFFFGKLGMQPFGPATRFLRPQGNADLSVQLDTRPNLARTQDNSAGFKNPEAVVEDAVTKVKLLNGPRPHFTQRALQNKTLGKVVLKVLFGSDGRVWDTQIAQGLPDGLNDEARVAAFKFAFTPAQSASGKPVPKWNSVTITFELAGNR
jgi:TonB family protein